MKILIAEDDPTSRLLLTTILRRASYDVEAHSDGASAWASLRDSDEPCLAILDWMMPGVDGTELCRRIKSLELQSPPYLILLTALGQKEDIVAGLESGANDYVTKPFHKEELLARVRVGERVLDLQQALNRRIEELEQAMAHIHTLQGLLPICAHCKSIRDDDGYWHRLEEYFSEHSQVDFTHGICPTCMKELYPEYVD